jgi:hypothetical protein
VRVDRHLVRAYERTLVPVRPELRRGCQVHVSLTELCVLAQHPAEHLRQLFDRRSLVCSRGRGPAGWPDTQDTHDFDEQPFRRARFREHCAACRSRRSGGLRVVCGDQPEHGNPAGRQSRLEPSAEFNSRRRVYRAVGQDEVGSEKRGFREALFVVLSLFYLEADRDGTVGVLKMEDVAWVDDQQAWLDRRALA